MELNSMNLESWKKKLTNQPENLPRWNVFLSMTQLVPREDVNQDQDQSNVLSELSNVVFLFR